MVHSHRHPAAYIGVDQRRAALLRRMADERVTLWEQVADIDAEALIHIPVFHGWTAKDLLAHVGSYDELFAERIRLVMAGRSHEIEGVDPDVLNLDLHVERRVWTLEQAVDCAIRARSELLMVLNQLSDTELHREREFPFGRFTVGQWIEWRALHDHEHAGDLAAWREAHSLGNATAPKSALLARLGAGREQLLAQLAGLEDSAFGAEVVNDWTLKDLISHIAGWDRWELDTAQRLLAGEPPDRSPVGDMDAYNARVVAAWRDRPVTELLDELDTARTAWVEILNTIPDAEFDAERGFEDQPWDFAELVRAEWDHDAEHAAQIAAWRRAGVEATGDG